MKRGNPTGLSIKQKLCVTSENKAKGLGLSGVSSFFHHHKNFDLFCKTSFDFIQF